MKIAVLCSGMLGYEALVHITLSHEVLFVCTDKGSVDIINYCNLNSIDLFIGNPRSGKITTFIAGRQVEVVVSVNYLFLVDRDLISLPSRIAFNIHGSLLPKYRGRTPHVWAIINGESVTGATAHIIGEDCDTGDIIEQREIQIDEKDTGADLLSKFRLVYPSILDSVMQLIVNNEVRTYRQDNSIATFFPKRTPEDGAIQWNWQRERIRNWVRALSYPYPGAFTFYEGRRITVDMAMFSNLGFHNEIGNGEILAVEPLIVKCPNGALELAKVREADIKFSIGGKFCDI